MVPYNSAKAKVQLRLSVQRLRSLQQKKEALAKSTRREIALILERGKIETARLKTEGLINEDIYCELLELLELYCELLIARFNLLDTDTRDPDVGIVEGVRSIVYAAPRTELRELHLLRDMLMHKYGREFSLAVMENQDGCVSDRVVRKVSPMTPSRELVDAYLAEIAKAYGVKWGTAVTESESHGNQDDTDAEKGVQGPSQNETVPTEATQKTAIDKAPSNDTQISKFPDIPPTEDKLTKTSSLPSQPASREDDFEVLKKRFDALKKR